LYSKRKKPSQIVTDKLINLIWEKSPRSKAELKNMIELFYPSLIKNGGIFEPYSSRSNTSYFDAIHKTINESTKKDYSNFIRFWERGVECQDTSATSLHLNDNYSSFHFNDWLHHYGQTKKYNGEYINGMNSFGHKLAGFINRLKEINSILNCHECNNKLVPDWNYGHQAFDSYRITVFECHDSSCSLKGEKIYINHCTGCGDIIDTRDKLNKCNHGRNICKKCYSCCKETHHQEHIGGHCPKCLEPQLVVFGFEQDTKNVKCYNCDFKISTEEINNNRSFTRFKFLNYTETSSYAIQNKKRKRK
tara:strand:- start:580 stop:1494 length:915 start_codon:yes stop_codon:yes gene_type:complete